MFTETNGMVEIVQENHFYPFGMQINGNWHKTQNAKNDYLYNGKELNTDIGLNWSDYGFRYYDAVIGRFTGVDPISDKFAWVSTYNYAENSPIVNIDLWGLQAVWSGSGLVNSPSIKGSGSDYAKNNPGTAAAIAVGFIAAAIGFAFAAEAGPAVTIAFIANEIKDEGLSILTDGAYDLFDLSKQLRNLPKYAKEISKNIGKIKEHLNRSELDYDAGNDIMLERLEKISKGELDATDTDINFYNHELTEKDYMDSGIEWNEAHIKSLEDAGIKYEKGVEKKLYTTEALEKSDEIDRLSVP